MSPSARDPRPRPASAVLFVVIVAVLGGSAAAGNDPTHTTGPTISLEDDGRAVLINTFCVDARGNLLAACGGERRQRVRVDGRYQYQTVSTPTELRVVSPEGRTLSVTPLSFKAEAINAAPDGAIYVGGDGKLAKFDKDLTIVATADAPTKPELAESDRANPRSLRITGIACSGDDVFVCCRAVKGRGYAVYRMDTDLSGARQVVTGLSGCCGQLDIQAHDGKLYAAENSRMRVVCYDRDGKKLAMWGRSARRGGTVEGFGSCCNPMNIRFGNDGMCYTSEASVGTVKRFTPDGEYRGLICKATDIPSCKHTPIGLSPDGSRLYMLDSPKSRILVFEQTPKEG